jgi:hypothetical protein
MGSGYGSMYFLTQKMEENIEEFEEIWGSISQKPGDKESKL